ncbi:polyribonucleotide nucleotidyltransferase [Patescibacteria group bacterium]|nr:MAG: polyribonucleotide nucleotidyltransferase [Patescibacteria group bacterium]
MPYSAPQTFEMQWGGRTLSITTGKVAKQANGSCLVRYGDTVVLGCATMGGQRSGISFFPLMVDFEEKLYAAGKIKSSRFIKREGRPTDEAVVTGRMIDRSIRPLFEDRIRNDIQVWTTVLSADLENDSDIVGLIAASAALTISDIPWTGPIGGIRVGRIDGQWVINPTFEAKLKSDMDLIVAGTSERVLMIEANAQQVPEKDMLEAIAFGQKHLREVTKFLDDVRAKAGRPKATLVSLLGEEKMKAEDELASARDEARAWLLPKIREALFTGPLITKGERLDALDKLHDVLKAHLAEQGADKDRIEGIVSKVDSWVEAEVTRAILEEDKRVDGRKITEVRPLSVEVGVLPRAHGSALFSRGETQVLSVLTLGSPGDEQTMDGMEDVGKKRYMHHYDFPAYSVGETGPNRGPGRREIGHGALAERALMPVVPQDKEKFPYTIRVVSEVLGSNGSSSQASICGSSLALMDAGVPIPAQVAGVAMGLASIPDMSKWKVLTDLQDLEDGKGGMDFKISGTRAGITAIQLDTKTIGLSSDLIEKTLSQARDCRMEVLDAMDKVISQPRPDFSPYAPRIVSFMINPELIRNVIGPGGKQINEIIDATGVQIDIEDSGLVMITSKNADNMQRAVDWVKQLTREVKVGEIYKGTVTRTMTFGAFVEILPKQEGLVHISELTDGRVERVEDAVKPGQEVEVKVVEIDSMGRINLSIRQAKNPDAPVEVPKRPAPRAGGGHPPFRGGR